MPDMCFFSPGWTNGVACSKFCQYKCETWRANKAAVSDRLLLILIMTLGDLS
jgi:hypothetical protein